MEIQSTKLVFFSPTGTSKTIVKTIAQGMGRGDADLVDFTRLDVRKQSLKVSENELMIVAVPVYGGRVAPLASQWLKSIQASKTPTVCVVLYGNREYEDALIELKDIVTECGCVPIACGAFIGEHSFSCSDTPIAVARPDADDLSQAKTFGAKIEVKLQSIESITDVTDIDVPGNRPYKELVKRNLDFIAVSDDCIQCGLCAEECPVGAIDPDDSAAIDTEKCIRCCACIKCCPQQAKSMKAGPMKDIAVWLNENCQARKEPVTFI